MGGIKAPLAILGFLLCILVLSIFIQVSTEGYLVVIAYFSQFILATFSAKVASGAKGGNGRVNQTIWGDR